MKSMLRLAAMGLVGLSLAGCGLFSSSGSSDKYKANDPNRPVAAMVANMFSLTRFTDANSGKQATYRAVLRDAQGNQFYGPKVLLDGVEVATTTGSSGQSDASIYEKTAIDVTPGKTYTTVVQDHTATSPPQAPPLIPTSPVPATSTTNGTTTTQSFYVQPLGGSATISWTGGDPAEPVYIFVEDTINGRRLYAKEDPAASPADPDNFGLPVANTGTYTMPAQVTQRVAATDGSISTQTLTVFDNQGAAGAAPRTYIIFVVQRKTTVASPIRFSVISGASFTAQVNPKTS